MLCYYAHHPPSSTLPHGYILCTPQSLLMCTNLRSPPPSPNLAPRDILSHSTTIIYAHQTHKPAP
jgi:hypothetical protein